MKISSTFILIFGFVFASFLNVSAQQNEEEIIEQTILTLFDGMRENNADKIKAVFTDNPEMYTVTKGKEGKTILKKGDFNQFVERVGKSSEKMLDEPIWNTEVRIDGNFATVWTDYAFYYGGKFSHCGVDAFSLIKEQGTWKIFHVTDTRKKEGCKIPKKVQKASGTRE